MSAKTIIIKSNYLNKKMLEQQTSQSIKQKKRFPLIFGGIIVIGVIISLFFFKFSQSGRSGKTGFEEEREAGGLSALLDDSTAIGWQKDGFKTYINEELGFASYYPENWIEEKGAMGYAVFFIAPRNEDKFQDNIGILIDDLEDDNITLKTFSEQSKTKLVGVIDDYQLKKDLTVVKISGLDGYEIVYQGEQNGKNLIWHQVWTIWDSKIYLITYTAGVETYQLNLDKFNIIAETFEIF